jgi:hypothetical protein
MAIHLPPGLRVVASTLVPSLCLGVLDEWGSYAPAARVDIETSLAICSLLVSRYERGAIRLGKLSDHCGIPRATMSRKMDRAIASGIAVECEGEYALATAFRESDVFEIMKRTLVLSVSGAAGKDEPDFVNEANAASCAELILDLADLLRSRGCEEKTSVECWALLWVLIDCEFEGVEARPALLARRTGLSRPTLYRWLQELQSCEFLMPGDLLPPRLVAPPFHAPHALAVVEQAIGKIHRTVHSLSKMGAKQLPSPLSSVSFRTN